MHAPGVAPGPDGEPWKRRPRGHHARTAPAKWHPAESAGEEQTAIKSLKLPSIKVDASTKMIDDSARRRADSVGSDVQQKPPTFKPKAYKSP